MFPNIFAVIFSTTQTKSKIIHKNFNPPPPPKKKAQHKLNNFFVLVVCK